MNMFAFLLTFIMLYAFLHFILTKVYPFNVLSQTPQGRSHAQPNNQLTTYPDHPSDMFNFFTKNTRRGIKLPSKPVFVNVGRSPHMRQFDCSGKQFEKGLEC